MDNTDTLCPDDDGAYNRRTTDYGNGRIEIAAYHYPRFRHTGNDKKSSYKGCETSDEEQEARTKSQIYAIRRRIKGYALSNNFRWFVTLTFDPKKVDSSDYETAKTTLLKWCRKMRDDYGQFDYLMIPELHKSGAVHFHGLLGDIPANFAEALNPKTGEPLIRHERQVYNLTDWEYGFSDCEEIESRERAASYITKYVTSALLTDKKMYNKKRYFNSQGLSKPAVIFDMSDNSELDSFTPNFGIIKTDIDGTNIVNIGIYNLERDPETGALSQTDDSYFIAAQKSIFPAWNCCGLPHQTEIKQQQEQEDLKKKNEPEDLRKKNEQGDLKEKNAKWLKHNAEWLRMQIESRRKKEEWEKMKPERERYIDEVFSKMNTEWQQITRGEEEHGKD